MTFSTSYQVIRLATGEVFDEWNTANLATRHADTYNRVTNKLFKRVGVHYGVRTVYLRSK